MLRRSGLDLRLKDSRVAAQSASPSFYQLLFVSTLFVAALAALGCGQPAAGRPDASHDHMKVIGLLFGMCQAENRGLPPAGEEQFIAYMQKEPANWEKLAPTPKQLLASPRNSEPLVVLYGKDVRTSADGDQWIAYEANPIEGKRMVVNSRGGVKLVDDQEFSQLVPKS